MSRRRGVITATHIWKRFRADRRRPLLQDEVARLRRRFAGDRSFGWTWALRDIDLRAEPGDSIGLIGENGSGKSTLLKILTRVMYPYAGKLRVGGRVGALIEVRAGIHPDLTGRENIFLYGSLLGLTRKQTAARFDEIVAFAELEETIDRQVKFYSSGMNMRLGFSVAAFLEPDILLVDEVLAVGDASFQQKCLERVREVLEQGTTLIFVSHDLAAVQATCSRGVWLDSGTVAATGDIDTVLQQYRAHIEHAAEVAPRRGGPIDIMKVEVAGPGGGMPRSREPLDVRVVLEADDSMQAKIHIGISEGTATPIFAVQSDLHLNKGQTEVRCTTGDVPLPQGRYYAWIAILSRGRALYTWQPVSQFDLSGPDLAPLPGAVVRLAPVLVEATWETSSD